jgi:trigger factor
VKGSLILDHISEKENISVSDEEMDMDVDKIALETNRPKEKVKEVLSRDSALERLRGQIRNKKTLDLIQAKARVSPLLQSE